MSLISQVRRTAPEPMAGADEPKRNKKRRSKRDDELLSKKKKTSEQEMKRLEAALFGSLYAPLEFGSKSSSAKPKHKPLFFEDRSIDNQMPVYEVEAPETYEHPAPGKCPVWIDEEEERTQVNITTVNRLRKLWRDVDEQLISGSEYVERLRAQHVKLNPGIDWAWARSD